MKVGICPIAWKCSMAHALLRPDPFEKADEVAGHDAFDVLGFVASFCEERRQPAQISNGIEVTRRLLAAECPIEIRADAGVLSVSGNLANVIDVIDDAFELEPC